MRALAFLLSILFHAPGAQALSALEKACARIVTQSPASDPRAVLAHAIGQGLDMERVRERVEELSGARPLPDGSVLKERGSDAARMIARLRIHELLQQARLKPRFENFPNGSNVIAEIKGSKHPNRVLELTAHYDSVGNPGADDNASGVGLLLELAAYMKQFRPEFTIRFVFMDLEERGFQGSAHHAKMLAEDQRTDLVGAIVIDTIGWAQEGGRHYLAVVEVGEERHQLKPEVYARQENFAATMFYLLNRIGRRDGIQFSPETGGAKPGTADHGSYWRQGQPAILVAAPYEPGFINPNYHRQSDTVANMNWEYYGLISRVIAELTAYVSGASQFLAEERIAQLTAVENVDAHPDVDDLKRSLPRAPALPVPPDPTTANPEPSGLFSRIFDFFWKRN